MGHHSEESQAEREAREAQQLVDKINQQQAAAGRDTTIAQPKDDDA